jgi:hypothetical protein
MNIDGQRIKVGYSTLKINTQATQFANSNMTDTYGQYLQRENKIEIQPDLSDVDEANTLIHEILHASVWISSLSQTGQPLEDSGNEELVINNLTNTLTQVFIDNEWLLPYLTEKLHNNKI